MLCGCDPFFPIFLSGDADRESYFPEFVSGYELDIVGQLWDAEFTKHAFGISPLGPNASQAPYETIGYAAYKSIRSDEPAHVVDGIYYQPLHDRPRHPARGSEPDAGDVRARHVQLQEPPRSRGVCGASGPVTTRTMDDFHEIFWDPNTISVANSKQGAWADPRPGKRYVHGANQMEYGPPSIRSLSRDIQERTCPRRGCVAALPVLYVVAYVLPGIGPKLERDDSPPESWPSVSSTARSPRSARWR